VTLPAISPQVRLRQLQNPLPTIPFAPILPTTLKILPNTPILRPRFRFLTPPSVKNHTETVLSTHIENPIFTLFSRILPKTTHIKLSFSRSMKCALLGHFFINVLPTYFHSCQSTNQLFVTTHTLRVLGFRTRQKPSPSRIKSTKPPQQSRTSRMQNAVSP